MEVSTSPVNGFLGIFAKNHLLIVPNQGLWFIMLSEEVTPALFMVIIYGCSGVV